MEYIESRRNRAVRVAVSCFLICALVFSVIACGMISPTVYAADTTIGVGPDNGIATGEQLARVSDKLPVYVGDLYGNIWGTETEIELFKVEYENNEHKVTIAGRNNESVIAPGTENSYAFSVKNESERILDYRVFIEVFFEGLDKTDKIIPVQVRFLGDRWIVGGENEFRPVMELNASEEKAILKKDSQVVYSVQWQWPFEQDLDGDGDIDDGDTLDTWLANRTNDVSLKMRITVLSVQHTENIPAVTEPIPPIMEPVAHYAYLYGFPDGTVRPEEEITRAEVAAMLYRLLSEKVRSEYYMETTKYSDVPEDAWYKVEVATLTNLGLLEGYPDGTFGGNNTITRAEIATILARISGKDITDEGRTEFSDIQGHWAKAAIMTIEDFRWIQGYPDGTFMPEGLVTRAETVAMINRMLHRLPESVHDMHSQMKTWPDNADPNAWYYLDIQEASNGHTYDTILGNREVWTGLID